MKMSKKAKIILVSTLAVVFTAGIGVGSWLIYDLTYCKPYGEYAGFTVGNAKDLKVGIISDSQLPASGKLDSRHINTLRSTLTAMKKDGIEVLIMAGDFTDVGTKGAWKSFETVYDEVFGNQKPIASFILGNHDYWLPNFFECGDIPSPQKLMRRFEKYTGEKPYTHKVVNGYHFIAWSPADGSYDKSYNDQKWIKEQLDIAVAADPTKPIFVTTHSNAEDTVYGSDDWGNKDITSLLSQYPQVISFSGHSHYPLEDERSINQKDFTAINTQTLDYIEVEGGKFNDAVPVDAYGNDMSHYPMGMIMTVTEGKVSIQRVAIDKENNETIEVKEPWVISAPFGNKDKFEYTNEIRIAKNRAPELIPPDSENPIVIADEKDTKGNNIKVIKFEAGKDDDFVHSYKLVFLNAEDGVISFNQTKYNGEEYLDKNDKPVIIDKLLYFSDFTMGIDKMSNSVALRLPILLPKKVARIQITAIDSWGAESNPIYYDFV